MCTTVTNYENFESFVKTPMVGIGVVMRQIRSRLSALLEQKSGATDGGAKLLEFGDAWESNPPRAA